MFASLLFQDYDRDITDCVLLLFQEHDRDITDCVTNTDQLILEDKYQLGNLPLCSEAGHLCQRVRFTKPVTNLVSACN